MRVGLWRAEATCDSFDQPGAKTGHGLIGRMSTSSSHEVTQLLQAWCDGNAESLERLMPLVYQELHRVARRYMDRENSGHTLQTTALVNEVYLRLVDFPEVSWQNRAHFFAICSKLMRQILTDSARSRRSLKRGGGVPELPFEEAFFVHDGSPSDLLALDDAMNHLAVFDQRKSQVVEMRFFGGLSVDETAEVLKVSPETVLRDWRLAKVWLFRELTSESRNAG
jgi:RNA polymerase sigma-70 factor (ECF subfamily)